MKALLDKAKLSRPKSEDKSQSRSYLRFIPFQDKVQKPIQQVQRPKPMAVSTPSETDVLRYRYNYGTNLGGIFVLEQWMFGSMFDGNVKGGSELDAVTTSIANRGLDVTRKKWQDHWSSALSDSEIAFLANTAHCTTIRLPIGYFTLGPAYTASTPFSGDPASIYSSAWSAVLNLCTRLHASGIGTLLDFHALPGGANTEAHSGTSSGHAELWNNSANLTLAKDCLVFLVKEVHAGHVPGCTGVQLCNEAISNAPGMYDFYTDAISAISAIDSSIPIYVSDGWDLPTALNWTVAQNTRASTRNSVIIDNHRYYTFSAADKAQSPQQIIDRIPKELSEVPPISGNVTDNGAAQVFVGEYSCVLDGETWGRVSAAEKPALIHQFGQAQNSRWHEASSGCTFWTAKMDWMDGGEWGFYAMTKAGNISPPANLTLSYNDVNSKIGSAKGQRDGLKARDLNAHTSYWDRTNPGQQFEHWRYSNGWDLGWADAIAFFGMRATSGRDGSGGDSIGALEVWIRKRIRDAGQTGGFVWEFEQGFRAGVVATKNLLGT